MWKSSIFGVRSTPSSLKFDFHTQVTLAVLYAFWMPAGSAYNVDAVLEVMIDGLRAEIDEREQAVDDAFAGRGDDARPGNPS